jgi:hypothetical protein
VKPDGPRNLLFLPAHMAAGICFVGRGASSIDRRRAGRESRAEKGPRGKRRSKGVVKGRPRLRVEGASQPEENDRSEGEAGPVNQEGKPTKPAQSGAEHEAGDYHKAVADDRREIDLIQDRSNRLQNRTCGSQCQW